MKLLAAIAAACLCASAFGQGVRYDHRVATIASNYPPGAQVPVMAIPNSTVTICTDGNCLLAPAHIYSNQGLTTQTANPMKSDLQGNFGFWAASGTYFYKVVAPTGTLLGIFPITLGGTGGGGTGCHPTDVAGTLQASDGSGGCQSVDALYDGSSFTFGAELSPFVPKNFQVNAGDGLGINMQAVGSADYFSGKGLIVKDGAHTPSDNGAISVIENSNFGGISFDDNGGGFAFRENNPASGKDGGGIIATANGGFELRVSEQGFAISPGDIGFTIDNHTNPTTLPTPTLGDYGINISDDTTDGIFLNELGTGQISLAANNINFSTSAVANFKANGSQICTFANPCPGGVTGFPITLGSTSIAASSTTTALTGLSVNGVTLNGAGSTSLFLNQAGGYTAPPGTGNTTSTSLTTNTLPVANGPNSIIDSIVSQSADKSTVSINGLGPGCISLGADQICITAPPYYASWQGATTTTTSGTFGVGTSGLIASCSTFLANEGVLITGAGTAGANYIGTIVSCTGTTLTVTPSTATSVATSTVVQHDETAAFLAAIAALNPSSGIIWVPDGVYLVNGPLLDTSGANAILPMPKIANYTTPLVDISIQGFTLPNWGGPPFTQGTVIQTSATTGNLFGGFDSATGGGFPPFTNVKLNMQNLTILTPANPGIVAVNATNILAFQGYHLLIRPATSFSLPSNTAGGGLFMPAVSNEIQNILSDVSIGGLYTDLLITEHTTADHIILTTSNKCLVPDSGLPSAGQANSISIQYMWTEACTNAIAQGTHAATVSIQNADFESNTNDITNSGGFIRGELSYVQTSSATPCALLGSYTPSANLTVNPIYCGRGSFSIAPIGGVNGNVNFGGNFGAPAVTLFDGGAANRYGWGLNGGEMQFFISNSPSTDHFSWNKGGDFQPSGTNELMRLFSTGDLSIGTTTDCTTLLGIGSGCHFKVDSSGNATTNNLTINGTCTGCGGGFPITLGSTSIAASSTTTTLSGLTLVAPVLGAATATSINGSTIPASATLTQTIASGTSALGTGAISSGACATVVTTTATGTATTDVVPWGFNADPTSTTGYSPTVNGMLTIIAYPTTNNVNFKVCNNTSASITPGAVTLNWRIVR